MFKESTTKEISKKKIKILVHGEPKIGKTKLMSTLPVEKDSDVLYIPYDPGYLILRDREFRTVSPDNNMWTKKSLEALVPYIMKLVAEKKIKWVVVDGLDDIGTSVLADFKRNNSNLQKAYGEMAEWLDNWIKVMRDIDGINIIFITHTTWVEDGEGEKNRYYPAIPGKQILKKIDQYFDIVMCMRSVQTEAGVERKLQVSVEADPRYVSGDRSGSLLPLEEPDLSKILTKIENSVPGSTRPEIEEHIAYFNMIKSSYSKPESKKVIDRFMESKGVINPRTLSLESLKELASLLN